MKLERRIQPLRPLLWIGILFCAGAFSAQAASPFLGWSAQAFGYRSAMAQHENREKPLLLYFYADWCPHCRNFEQKVLSDSRVREVLSQFAKAHINPEKGDDEKDIAREYGVRGFPTLLLKLPGQRAANINRGDNAGAFIEILKQALGESRAAVPQQSSAPNADFVAPTVESQRRLPEAASEIESVPQEPQTTINLRSGETIRGTVTAEQGNWITVHTRYGKTMIRRDDITSVEP